MAESTKRYAVVTSANKGIGFEICRQLASSGIVVVLTSRDEKRGLQAVQKLKDSGLSDYIIFHQLDVINLPSVLSLAKFIETQFRTLDILVNNAGVLGATINEEALIVSNYLKYVSSEWARGVLSDIENLTEEKVDEVVNVFLEDFKNGSSAVTPAYILSKAAVNAYTRILTKKFPGFCINCVCPGSVITDINHHKGILSAEEGAESPVKLALLPNGGIIGCFFIRKEKSEF